MLYRFGDLTLSSDEPFSHLPEDSVGPAECSVERARHTGPELHDDRWDHHWRSQNGDIAMSCARDGNSYRLGVPGLATFFIEEGGRAITCHPEGDLPTETLEHLLIDQVLPRVLVQRDRLVLHAGCIETPDGAIAFLGDSGAGKSTLCAAFARAGDPILGDDGIVIRRGAASGFEAIATYPGLRLFPGPLESLFDDRAPTRPVAHATSKRRLDRADPGVPLAAGPSPLRGLYRLEAGPQIEIAPLEGGEPFVTLVRSCFQLHLDDPERSRDLFERIGALIDAVPVRRLTYPRDYDRLPEVRRALLEDSRT